jgi:hypothetical protein
LIYRKDAIEQLLAYVRRLLGHPVRTTKTGSNIAACFEKNLYARTQKSTPM